MNKALMVIVVLLIAGGAFFGGMQYQKSQRTVRAGQPGGQGQFFSRTVGQQGGRPVSGSIISSDEASVTVKLADGSSKIVLFSGSTVVNKQTTGSKSDLTTGERIMVIGKENSDGSVTAETISLSPILREINGTPSAR